LKPTIVAPQMPHDVFISHSTAGKSTANAICNELESVGIRCWILPRDLDIDISGDQSIANAVGSCRIMIVVFTDYACLSDRIERQLETAFNRGVVIIPFRTESIAPGLSESLLDSVHWLDALTPEMGTRLRSLCDLVRGLLFQGRNDAPVLKALVIGEAGEARLLHSERITELDRVTPTKNEERRSKDDIIPRSPDADLAENSQVIVEEIGENEQKAEEVAKLPRRQPRRTPKVGAVTALLLTLTPLLIVLGVGYWRSKTEFKPGLAKSKAVMNLPSGKPAAKQTRTEVKFSPSDPGWGTPDANWSVTDGQLRITPLRDSSAVLINQARGFKDAEVTVDVVMSKGENMGQLGGLIFWAKGYNDCYAMVISADGRFAVGHKLVGRWINPISETESTAVKTGIGQVNKLRIRTQGNLLNAYINDIQVATLAGEPPQGDSYIGLYGESAESSQNVWDFANVTVTGVR
jgi:TIR domain/Domain of Unknown Function (DUF1080)